MAEEAVLKKITLPKLEDTQEFYLYRLVQKNDPKMQKAIGSFREYNPYTSIPHESTVVIDNERVRLRYLEGVDTILVSEQEAKKIPDDVIKKGKSIAVIDGELRVHRTDKMLRLYLEMTSYNESSDYRVLGAKSIIMSVDETKESQSEVDFLDTQAEAIEVASGLSETEMLHIAKALNVEEMNNITQTKRRPDLIRKDVRMIASKEPRRFLAAAKFAGKGDSYLIKKALEDGKIVIKDKKAVWATSGTELCDVATHAKAVPALEQYIKTEDGKLLLEGLQEAYEKK